MRVAGSALGASGAPSPTRAEASVLREAAPGPGAPRLAAPAAAPGDTGPSAVKVPSVVPAVPWVAWTVPGAPVPVPPGRCFCALYHRPPRRLAGSRARPAAAAEEEEEEERGEGACAPVFAREFARRDLGRPCVQADTRGESVVVGLLRVFATWSPGETCTCRQSFSTLWKSCFIAMLTAPREERLQSSQLSEGGCWIPPPCLIWLSVRSTVMLFAKNLPISTSPYSAS